MSGAVGSAARLGRPNVFEIDLGAIAHNVRVIRAQAESAELWAALKADAYGYGLVEAARAALEAGADALAVGDVGEGVRLRQSEIRHPILVYPGTQPDPEAASVCAGQGLIATVYDEPSLAACLDCDRGLQVFLKVDAGLQRLGFAPDQIPSAAARLAESGGIEVAGIYTHLHVPDDPAAAAGNLLEHFVRFTAATVALPGRRRMAASSRVLARFPKMALDAVDPGRAVYGIRWRGDEDFQAQLRPAFSSLKTRLLQVKVAAQGPHAPAGSRLGVIALGMRDGLPQLTCGQVLVGGRRVSLVGPVALEHARVALDAVPGAQPGDEVVVIGRQGTEEITVAEILAARPALAPTAFALAVGHSVERVYLS